MRRALDVALTVLLGSVWVFHGLYSKILDGIPRHRLIVARILGEDIAPGATIATGVLEVLLGVWIFTRRLRVCSFLVQCGAILSMNALEIRFANDLLVSAPGMVALNLVFLTLAGYWALRSGRSAR
jgi:hypothetical protein